MTTCHHVGDKTLEYCLSLKQISAMVPHVYEYSNPSQFLKDSLVYKKAQNPRFSMRAWAKAMGFTSHSSLVLLLNGRRQIRTEHLEKLQKGLKLSESEGKYFRALVRKQLARDPRECDEIDQQLRLWGPQREEALLETERFRLIADWIHMAILEMTRLRDFQPNAQWIQNRLHRPVALDEIEKAIQRLFQLGLLQETKEPGHKTWNKTNERLTTPKDRASESIREYHRQVIGNALEAIDSQGVQERVLNSCTMTIQTRHLDAAKELIAKFRADMAKLLEADGGDETYQLSVQFFRLTRLAGLTPTLQENK